MKTSFKAKIIIETDKYKGCYSKQESSSIDVLEELTMLNIKDAINRGHFTVEFIDSFLSNEVEPTLIIKI